MDILTTQDFSSFSISRYEKILELQNKVAESMKNFNIDTINQLE